MVKQLIFLCCIVLSSFAYGQEEVSKSKIKFNDGSEIHAVIKENLPGKYIKIALPDNEDVTIKYANIIRIKHKDYNYYSKYVRIKGFYIEGTSSFLFGRASEYGGSRLGVALGATANYQLNSHLSIGAGIEPTALLITNENILIPVYARFKFNLSEKSTAPVLILDAGWSFTPNNKDEFGLSNNGGWYARPAVGMQISNFTLSLGYQLQKITTTQEFNGWWRANQVTVEEGL